jgi:hypothetical protein
LRASVSLNEPLTQIRSVELGNDTTPLAEDIERGSGLEGVDQQPFSGGA